MDDFTKNAGAMLLHYIREQNQRVSDYANGKILSKEDPRFDLYLLHEFDKLRMLVSLAVDAGYAAPPTGAEAVNSGELRIGLLNEDCNNTLCPWRSNGTTNKWYCELLTCPNRDSGDRIQTTNRIEKLETEENL